MTTGKYIRSQRLRMGITQVELASHLSVKVQFINAIEAGRSKLPLKILQPLIEYLMIDDAAMVRHLVDDYRRKVKSSLK
ncbi:MAG TPA: helix-turn-helix transcriptional regulator [Armatimonadota bacterium]|mgnify:CR=1 FL=1|nr:helix-turn-helix transcriptional regulator [Armatimonadota bacterium]